MRAQIGPAVRPSAGPALSPDSGGQRTILRTLTIDLTDLPQGANYDLFLFDDRVLKGAQFIEQSRNIGNAAERIVHTSAKAMRYYIRVVMYTRSTSAPNTYILAANSS